VNRMGFLLNRTWRKNLRTFVKPVRMEHRQHLSKLQVIAGAKKTELSIGEPQPVNFDSLRKNSSFDPPTSDPGH